MSFSNGKPIPNSGSDPASERVAELFSELRSSFFGMELEKVAKKFIEREEEMNEHLIVLEKNVEQLLKDKDVLCLENKELKDDLKKKQKKIDALTAANVAHKNEAKLLGKSQKVRVLEKENDDLKEKIREYRKRFMGLDKRILMLEDSAKDFAGGVGLVRCSLHLAPKQHKDCDTPVAAAPESSTLLLSNEKGDSNKRTEPKVQEVIHIDDVDEDEDDDDQYISTLKRKGFPNEIKKGYNGDENNSDNIFVFKSRRVSKEVERKTVISAETQNRKNLDLHDQHITSYPLSTPNSSKIKPKNLMPCFDISNPHSGQDMKKFDEPKKENVRWQSEADMLEQFNKDDELCLNGICALHRQKFRAKPFDILRLSQLARMLIDEDPQQKLKKKASELKQFDLDHCRRFAREDYLSAIFDIYQRKVDPFFPSSSSKENLSDD